MRRIVLAAVAASALGVAAPAAALAAHHGHHHHKKRSSHHAKGAHLLRFGTTTPSGTTTSAPATGGGVRPGDAGAQQGSSDGSTEPIGTIASFENNVLTIELTSKELVKGTVSPDTRIACRSESAATTSGGDSQDGEGDQPGDSTEGEDSGGDQQEGDQTSGDQAHASDTSGGGDSTTPCEASVLTQPTTKVLGAELRLTSAGAEWEWLVVSIP